MVPDDAIQTKENDRLNRFPLAAQTAAMIRRFRGDESLVIGVEGEWGSGKLSFINLILGELPYPTAITVQFNP